MQISTASAPRFPMRRETLERLLRQTAQARYGSPDRLLYGVCADYALFLGYSFAGWLWESVGCSIANYGRFINRGFLNGPYCPIYGKGALLAVYLLRGVKNPVLLFLSSGTVCCALEYVTSWGMEKLFHARWWDYSDKPFNLNGRVYLNGFLAFGAASALLVRHLDPYLRRQLDRLPPVAVECAAALGFLVYNADNIITLTGFTGLNDRLQELTETLEQLPAAERIHAARDAFAQRMNAQQRRILSAFPTLRSARYSAALSGIREHLSQLRSDLHE